jgi:hypothetical protein
MVVPQDWAPYSSVEEAAKVYLRDPDLALDQIRSVIDLSAIKSFIMSRGSTEESWGEALWQEVVLTDGQRLIIWRADDELSTADDRERRQRRPGPDAAPAAVRPGAVAVHAVARAAPNLAE